MSRLIAWGVLNERSGTTNPHAHNAGLDIASQAGLLSVLASMRDDAKGKSERGQLKAFMANDPSRAALYDFIDRFDITQVGHIGVDYQRTDMARNRHCVEFLKVSSSPKDWLIMLDADHIHPMDIIPGLCRWDVGVVGALAFRRGEPYFPCFFVRGEGDVYHVPSAWDKARPLMQGTIVGTGAIAIQAWVLHKLNEAGCDNRFFRYEYDGTGVDPSEDIYFGKMCEAAGIPHYCDASMITPHLTWRAVTDKDWYDWQAAHPNAGDLAQASALGQVERVPKRVAEAMESNMLPMAGVLN